MKNKMEMFAIGGVSRGCGRRKQGGVYAECGTRPDGMPMEHFIICPPVRVDPAEMGFSPVGVKLVPYEADGKITWHVWDWVGSEYYPNVSDFVEEMRRFGLSRRLSRSLDFGKLSPESRIFLMHSAAWIENPKPYQKARIGGKALGLDWETCPKGIHQAGEKVMCAGLWWEDVEGLKDTVERVGDRVMPSFQYRAADPVEPAVKHGLALFASFPVMRLAVVQAEDGSHEATASDIEKATSLPVAVVEE